MTEMKEKNQCQKWGTNRNRISKKHSGYPKGITKDTEKNTQVRNYGLLAPAAENEEVGNKDEIEEGEEEKEDNAKRTKTVMSNYVKNIKKRWVYIILICEFI